MYSGEDQCEWRRQCIGPNVDHISRIRKGRHLKEASGPDDDFGVPNGSSTTQVPVEAQTTENDNPRLPDIYALTLSVLKTKSWGW